MSSVILPTLTDGTERYNLRIPLGGEFFGFEFRWNARDGSWSFALSDASGAVLLSRKLVVSFPMLFHAADERLPDGELYAVDSTGADEEPGLTDLGSRVLLTFTPYADIVANL
jgi:hypothetical protein